jgi:ribosome-binding protein aMBF1 (putative translation factor)
LARKTLAQVARDVRLPTYILSAIERGEIEPSPRWIRRFEEVYGVEVAAALLAPIDATGPLGLTVRSLGK